MRKALIIEVIAFLIFLIFISLQYFFSNQVWNVAVKFMTIDLSLIVLTILHFWIPEDARCSLLWRILYSLIIFEIILTTILLFPLVFSWGPKYKIFSLCISLQLINLSAYLLETFLAEVHSPKTQHKSLTEQEIIKKVKEKKGL